MSKKLEPPSHNPPPNFKEEEVSLGFRRVYKINKDGHLVEEEIELKSTQFVPIDVDE